MIRIKELEMLKKRAVLINAPRGGLADERALLDVLKSVRIWSVVLDATEVEPASLDSHGEFLKLM
jgi:phosphoglycerate dehydrogenase-like enzyme